MKINDLIDEYEIRELAKRYGPFKRRRYTLRMGEGEFSYWRDKIARDRRGEVVLVIQRPGGQVILHTKDFYPADTYRLPSGGIRWDEDVLSAVRREAREETGLEVKIECLLGVIEYEFRCKDAMMPFVSYVFLVREAGGELAPQDDEHITSFRLASPEELSDIAAALRDLKGDWKDWGRFRAIAHDLVAEVLANESKSVAFDPLERVHPDHCYLVASGLISVFKKIWFDFWGPRLEHILRYSLLTLLECPKSTLLDLPRLLTDKEFRKGVLEGVANQQVREFWFFEFGKYSARFRSEAISPILNKIGRFLASIPLRNIVGQGENTFDLRKSMDEGKILIVNLAKGKIGEDNCSLLGAMMVTKIQLAALSRADLPEKKRRPFYLYVDEIHNLLTLSFTDILPEARKYGLDLILTHQHLEQLDERIRAAIFGNVGTIISFRVGAEDAEYLAREFHPVFDEADLANLPNYHIYLKLLINGASSRPFSAITLPPPKRRTSHKGEAVELSRKRYARPRKEVEREILFRRPRPKYRLF